MQNWKIGGAFSHFQLLINFFEIAKYVDNPNFKFNVYDTPANIIWQGGRCDVKMGNIPDEEFINAIERFNSLNVGFTFIFSSNLIEKEDLADKKGNFYLEKFNKKGNGVVILNDNFADYVRKHYSEYKLTLSLTHMNRKADKDWYMRKFEKYDNIVLLGEKVNEEFLSQFEPEYIKRFEVMSNEYCFYGCPHRELHYRLTEIANKTQNEELLSVYSKLCMFNVSKHLKKTKQQILKLKDCMLTYEEIDKFKQLGIENWKMVGRSLDKEQLYFDLTHYLFREMQISPYLWHLHDWGLLLNTDEEKQIRAEKLKIEEMTKVIKKYGVDNNLKYTKF
jgi:collagenase-like PrtC family protease